MNNPFIGFSILILGFTVFCYSYWKAKFGSNLNWQSLLGLVIGGLSTAAYGIYLLTSPQ